jgi:cell filamentation protein
VPREIYDKHWDDEHRILRNTLGITDPHELEPHIARLSYWRVAELLVTPVKGHFDIPHLRSIHRHIFQDVFPWAGDLREVTTSRTNSFSFPPPQFLILSLETLFTNLRKEDHLKHLERDRFILRAAHYLGELNAIHPFREGNGRAQREFIRTLALTAGHPISWKNLTAEENNEASRISFATGNTTGLAAILRKCLV